MENLNTTDRVIRSSVGTVLMASVLVLPLDSVTIAAMALASFYPLMTALLSWDPAYSAVMSITSAMSKRATDKMPAAEKEKLHI
ncbi:MAG: DUF2892 domain-containing protein [Gammaproteobacteria bacterium]|nr:DUF2892 domain-containing protein [Gammaproteobacteria bacterium]